MAKYIMVQGTMSGVGKSLLVAALCRIFRQDGYNVAPFKSQNMALNSYITADGFELGRAQAVQAQAAGKEPDVRMNPILLKPSSDVGSQLIVHGEVRGDYRAVNYFKMKKSLIPEIMADFNSLASENDIIVIEGAGSPAEINLRRDDIVNMGFAELVNAPVILVGDIDPGGVFAQLYGTFALLEQSERARIVGLLINKFRGDIELLRPGVKMLEDRCGIPVLGVVPYVNADIDDEDSLSPRLSAKAHRRPIDIAVIRLPHISNFTDFSPLEQHPALGVRYVGAEKELGAPDMIILPGTKNTMADLEWLRASGLEAAIKKLAAAAVPVLGVCGGYQMLGRTLSDPYGVEHGGSMAGMNLLPCDTVFAPQKTRTRVTANCRGAMLDCYEIHMGITDTHGAMPFAVLSDGTEEGAVCGNVSGTYLHGLFDSGELTKKLADACLRLKGIEAESFRPETHREYLDRQFDILADNVRKNIDMDAVYAAMDAYSKGAENK